MGGNVVFVTATDYVTVYTFEPTYTSVVLPPSTVMQPTQTEITSPMSSITLSSRTGSGTYMSTLRPPSVTAIPLLPSEFAVPQSKPWSDHIASLSIAAVVLFALILFGFLAYAIYMRIRGKCPACENNEAKLRKWETGELKLITKEMVQTRAKRSSQALASTGADVEKGEVCGYDAERQAARDAALAALTRLESVVIKSSLWDRAKGMIKGKDKSSQPAVPFLPERHVSQQTVGDRFFMVGDVESIRHSHQPPLPPFPTVQYEPSPKHDRAYDPPSPSTYSRATNSNVGYQSTNLVPQNGGSSPTDDSHPFIYSTYLGEEWHPRNLEHHEAEPEVPRNEGSVISSTLNINNRRYQDRYDVAQRIMHRKSVTDTELQRAVDDVNVVEGQMRRKRRSRTYGGLPHPEKFEDFEDVDMEGENR
jgi:hypothetical protein